MAPVRTDTVPCGFCGEPSRMRGTQICDNCWEIKGRVHELAQKNIKALEAILKPFGFQLERKK